MEMLTVKVDHPLDLRGTLSYLHGHFRPDGWWSPMRTPDGAATLHLRRIAADLEARAFGPGASWALASVPALIGADDRPEEFHPSHPLVRELHRRHSGLRFGRTGRVFEALVVAILTQKVTGKEAGRSLRLLRRRYSEPAPGPNPSLRLPPDPERIGATTYFELHPLGIEKRRADVLLRVARQAEQVNRLEAIPSADARRWLERIPGIGPWTSAETTSVSHGDADAVSVGDFHLKNVVVYHLTGRPRGTDEEMMELLGEFAPHRARVARLVETLGHAPAFGPRQPIRDFARY